MKKSILCLLTLFLFSFQSFSADGKMNLTLGGTPVQSEGTSGENNLSFGGAYLLFDGQLKNEWVTLGGKIYWRISEAAGAEDLAQKLEVKKAYVLFRPFSNNLFETGIGKLYSYYLPGAYFSLAEVYTGSSRWGKTGLGVKSTLGGFTFGAALPLTESYKKFSESFSINAGLSYDFSTLAENLPLTAGATLFYTSPDFSSTLSLLWKIPAAGLLKASQIFAGFSFNSEAYVSSSVFKNVSNYASVTNADFFSLNGTFNFEHLQWVIEAEAGKCVSSDFIPLYAGSQLMIPFVKWESSPNNYTLAFRPRFFYYAALNGADSSLSRSSYEFYPRLYLTSKKLAVSLGADLFWKEDDAGAYSFSWSLPFYVEIKYGR